LETDVGGRGWWNGGPREGLRREGGTRKARTRP